MAYDTISVLCILSPGRLINKFRRDVMDRDFVYSCSSIFNYIWGSVLWCAGHRSRGA